MEDKRIMEKGFKYFVSVIKNEKYYFFFILFFLLMMKKILDRD